MLIRYPGQAGRDELRLASNIDVAPTLADLGRAVLLVAPNGVSLVPALQDPTRILTTHDALLEHWLGGDEHGNYPPAQLTTPGFYAIRTRQWRYVEVTSLSAPNRREYELYDELGDPGELVNLADDPAYADIQADLKTQLYALVTATGADPSADQAQWTSNVTAIGPGG